MATNKPSRLFGQCPIVVGQVYTHRDLNALDSHRSPEHFPVMVRGVQVDEAGAVRVLCAHPLAPGEVSPDGYDPVGSLLTFPCYLRAV